MRATATFALLTVLALACGDDEANGAEEGASAAATAAAASDEPEDRVDRAARIARELREDPDDAEAILESHGMTVEELEELMIEIAADEEESQRYEELIGDAEE